MKTVAVFDTNTVEDLHLIKNFNDLHIDLKHKILSEISLEDIKKTIHLFEDWYSSYKNSEIANDDDDLDSDNFDRNRVIHFKTIVLPCHDMDSDKLCNLFEQVYDKFYKIK